MHVHTVPVEVPVAISVYSSASDFRIWIPRTRLSPQTILKRAPVACEQLQSLQVACTLIIQAIQSPVYTSNNAEATLSNGTSQTILSTKSNVASTKSNVASTLLLVWTGHNTAAINTSSIDPSLRGMTLFSSVIYLIKTAEYTPAWKNRPIDIT